MVTGKIAKFETLGMLDGPGVRTVVFMQGCILRCAYCHNPALLTFQGGEEYTPKQLCDKILRFKNYYKDNGGVTVSGGEPLCQTEFVTEFFRLCKEENISTCLDTSGIGFGNFDELLKYTDLVLLDIKHVSEEGFLELTLQNKSKTEAFHAALIKSKVPLWIRQVIIPDVTDSEEYLQSLLKEISKFDNIQKIEFLPFHTMSNRFYEELGIENRYQNKRAMDNAKAMDLQKKFVEMFQNKR